MADGSAKVRLYSSDNRVIEVDATVARMSRTIRTLLENSDNREIPVSTVTGDTLEVVMQWATHHKDDPDPEIQKEETDMQDRRTDDISAWDQEFVNGLPQPVIFDLIVAASDLDIKGLLDVTCKTVANMIKGKTVAEIRQAFNVQNDLTVSEEEQIRKENDWCDDK